MAGSDFVNDRWTERYLPVTNRNENGRTPAVQAAEEKIVPDETYQEWQQSAVTFAGKPEDKGLHEVFRDT